MLGTELSSVSARVARALSAEHCSSPAVWFARLHRACSLLAEVVFIPWGLTSFVGTADCQTLPQDLCRNHCTLMMGLVSDKTESQDSVPPRQAAGPGGCSASTRDGCVQFHPAVNKIVLISPSLNQGWAQGHVSRDFLFLLYVK